MLRLLGVSTRYDAVLAAITVSQLRAGDGSPGHVLSEEWMRAVLLRIVLRAEDGRVGEGEEDYVKDGRVDEDDRVDDNDNDRVKDGRVNDNDRVKDGRVNDDDRVKDNHVNDLVDHCDGRVDNCRVDQSHIDYSQTDNSPITNTPITNSPITNSPINPSNNAVILRKLLEPNDPTLFVALLKQLRLLARQHPLSSALQRTIVQSIATKLPELPPFARKPALKTLFLFRSQLPRALPALLPLVRQVQDREVSYWATRLLAAISLADGESHEEEAAAAVAVVKQLDISLSYRSLLADLALLGAESKTGDPIMRALTEVATLALLRDGNASLRRVAVGREGMRIPDGVEAAEERVIRMICEEKKRASIFCVVCGKILVAFLKTASPEVMMREEEEVGVERAYNVGVQE